MKIVVKYLDKLKEFENKQNIIIANKNCDFVIEDLSDDIVLKLIYTEKYKNYVLINSSNDNSVLCNEKPFSKILVTENFKLNVKNLTDLITVTIKNDIQNINPVQKTISYPKRPEAVKTAAAAVKVKEDIFNGDIEHNRIAIIKEIGYRITELKDAIKSTNITAFMLNIAIPVLSVVCAFGMTNFLLGLKIDNSTSVLNLTTNAGFLVCMSAIVIAISYILKQGIYSLLDSSKTKKFGDNNFAQKFIVTTAGIFMFIVYIINLFYYKDIPGFSTAAFFISLLFAGTLATVSSASGYFKFQLKELNTQLTNCEYREDFEAVMKSYRSLIHTYVNKLTPNRINSVKANLVNNQLKMIVETVVGLLTAPFLAYGVSNTLAGCFPEAANWVRISGLRFSPIFLVLATFLIIFAFFSFVRAFTIAKQIKGSEIIKFDGFHDYASHGVTVLGLDALHGLNKEKNIVLFIACFIILIEFTMNVSYFITEIGGDIQGMFLSFVTALVPTALLIAETHLLSSTMFKINNYNELLSNLD